MLHLDTLFWKPGWVPTPPDEREAVQRRELASPAWIADAQYDDILPDWVEEADTVCSSTSRRWCASGASAAGGSTGAEAGPRRPGPSPGRSTGRCGKFVRNQWLYRRKVRRELLAELGRERAGRRVVVVRRSGDADKFLRSVDSPGL